MATSTLRPNGTIAHTGDLDGTGATAHAVTLDNSDATYTELELNENYVVTLGDLTLPAGAIILRVAIRLRTAVFGAAINLSVRSLVRLLDTTQGNIPIVSGNPSMFWPTAVTFEAVREVAAFSDAQMDGALLQVLPQTANNPVSGVRLYEAYVDVTYAGPPTAVPVSPANNATITTDDTPRFIWGYTPDTDGGPIAGAHIRVFEGDTATTIDPDADDPVLDSDFIEGGTLLYTFGDDPLDEGDYQWFVREGQYAGDTILWSDWESPGDFTIDVPRPDDPEVTITSHSPRGRIDIALSPGPDLTTVTHAYEVQRSTDNGDTWEEIRTLIGEGLILVDGDPMHIFDYEVPNGYDVKYRVRAVHLYDLVSGVGHSGWTESITMFWQGEDWWLKHPTNPRLNRKVVVRSQPSRTQISRAQPFSVLGRRLPVVVSDVPVGWRGELVLRSDDEDSRVNLDLLLSTGDPILIQAPPGVAAWQDTWAAVGDVTRERAIDHSNFDTTWDSIPWTEVDPPDGDLTLWT